MYTSVRNKAANWVNQSFMVPNNRLGQVDARRRLFNEPATKFTDSSLGGNWAINPPPQFTENADIDSRAAFIVSGLSKVPGQGRYYSDSIDDNSQLLFIRAGIPQYNPLLRFFTNFYNVKASMVARHGRMSGAAYDAGKAVGFVVYLPVWPLATLNDALRWVTRSPASKFYFLKPTMGLYWNAVTSIVNHLGVNLGMVFPADNPDSKAVKESDPELPDPLEKVSPSDIEAMIASAPELYFSDGSLDVYAVANRASRLAYKRREEMTALLDRLNTQDEFIEGINKFQLESMQDSVKTMYLSTSGGSGSGIVSLHGRLMQWFSAKAGGEYDETATDISKAGLESEGGDPGFFESLINYTKSELQDGAAFATFRVNQPRGLSDSFSNSTAENQLASEINSFSSTARNARVAMANGNFIDGAAGDSLASVFQSSVDFLGGIADGIGIGGAKAILGNAFVDIPKNWDASQSSTTPLSFNFTLKAAYGTKRTIYQQILFPMAMLIALAAARSTGRHSYTGPFLIEAYCQGVAQTRLGIVNNLTFNRGAGVVGFTQERLPLQVDVSLSIEELSSIFHMAIAPSFSIDPLSGMFDEDSLYTDYLNTLSGLGLSDQIYIRKRWGLNLKRKMASWRADTSPARWASWFNGTDTGRIMNALAREIDRSPTIEARK